VKNAHEGKHCKWCSLPQSVQGLVFCALVAVAIHITALTVFGKVAGTGQAIRSSVRGSEVIDLGSLVIRHSKGEPAIGP
jgi:hypothetical protein